MGKRNYLGTAMNLGTTYAKGFAAQTKTGVRYIICNNASGNWGKSTILSAVADYYISNPTKYRILYSVHMRNDRWCAIQEIQTGKVIIVQTKGDVPGCYAKTLFYMLKKGNLPVDIVVCACHPNDLTHQIVEALAGNSFKLYYFSNFSVYKKLWLKPSSNIVKSEMRDCIVNIVDQLLINKQKIIN